MYKRKTIGLLCMSLLSVITSYAAAATAVNLELTDSSHHVLGSVEFQDTSFGLLITPKLEKLPAGLHGFHLHQNADCSEQGMAAGGHFDPEHTSTHQGPYGHGHKGDLPVLYVDAKGDANTPTLAPRLKVTDLKHLAVMVHLHGDNYTDTPPLGGGGARLACGVIK